MQYNFLYQYDSSSQSSKTRCTTSVTCAMQALLPGLPGLLQAIQGTSDPSPAPGELPFKFVDMKQIPGLPLMPTLFGILLGYPAVYLVEGGQEGAQKVSRALSDCQLQRVRLYVHAPEWLAKALNGAHDSNTVQAEQFLSAGGKKGKQKGMVVNGVMKDADEYLKGYVIASMTVPADLLHVKPVHEAGISDDAIPHSSQTVTHTCQVAPGGEQAHAVEEQFGTNRDGHSIQERIQAWHRAVDGILHTHASLCWPDVTLEQVCVEAGLGVSL